MAFLCLVLGRVSLPAAERPNILWLTSEDNSPYLGCYGDSQAQTPHLDRLATQGVRYRLAFANAPVCSSARTTLITGMYATSLGAQHHRSRVAIPASFPLYPEVLRAAGYYTTNNAKTDYNLAGNRQPWNASSAQAHYKNRAPGQPFFAVFNFGTSHESQVAPKEGKTSFRIAPEKIQLPPYHPDTPEIRRDWANYYDQMTIMDAQVGAALAELERAGLAEDTIVFYYGDHGGALPRGKRNIHDSGTRVPFIVRIPAKWAHLAPAKSGEWVEQPVAFVDFPATVFSLCGVPIPANYEGRPFLGEKKTAPREHVFLYRGRMDERTDVVRAVRDREYRYVRNYSPHRPWGQHYSYPFEVQPSMRSWFAEFTAGRCNDVQAAYWRPKPSEEFYRLAGDPHELRNLVTTATDPSTSTRRDRAPPRLARRNCRHPRRRFSSRGSGSPARRLADHLRLHAESRLSHRAPRRSRRPRRLARGAISPRAPRRARRPESGRPLLGCARLPHFAGPRGPGESPPARAPPRRVRRCPHRRRRSAGLSRRSDRRCRDPR
jgi:N-sulfoglucosamine sulfohydrolase